MPVPVIAYGAYSAAAAGASAAFRFAASPAGQRAITRTTEFLYENRMSIGASLAGIYNNLSRGTDMVGEFLFGSAQAAEPTPQTAAATIPAGPRR